MQQFFSKFLYFVDPLWNARSPSSDRVESCARDMFQAWSGERGARAGFLKIWRGILRILTSGSSEISKTLIWSFSKLRRSWEQRFSQNTGGMLGDRLRLPKITNLTWISPFWSFENHELKQTLCCSITTSLKIPVHPVFVIPVRTCS